MAVFTSKCMGPGMRGAAKKPKIVSPAEKNIMLSLTDQTTGLDGLDLLDREDLIAMVKRMVNGGVSLGFHGKRTAMEISRTVRPRVTRRMKELPCGYAGRAVQKPPNRG